MHFLNEYINSYNETKYRVQDRLIEIENKLDSLIEIKTVDNLEEFYENDFKASYKIIEINIKFIIDYLHQLQKFCHEDIRNIIPKIRSLDKLTEKESFKKAKNIDWLIEAIKTEQEIDSKLRAGLLEISEFNKKIRYFIHSTLSFVENPLPIVPLAKIKRLLKSNTNISADEIVKDVAYCLSECNRIKQSFEKFHILSNAEYGHWESLKVKSEDILEYFNLYKNRFSIYYYNDNLYNIVLDVSSSFKTEESYSFPFHKVKEIIDVMLHNAAEELVSKEIAIGEYFDKKIICRIAEKDEMLVFSIGDNGRGFTDENIDLPFYTTKNKKTNFGIGLDIANQNIKILKGHIERFNNFNNGATFEFAIPKNIVVNKEEFKHKVNVVVVGETSSINKKVKELTLKYNNIRIITLQTANEIQELLKKDSLRFVNIVLFEKNESRLINKFFAKYDFKGQLIGA